MNAQSLIENDQRRGVEDVQAEIDALEREWDEADDKPHLAWKKKKITKEIENKRRWLKLYQALQ